MSDIKEKEMIPIVRYRRAVVVRPRGVFRLALLWGIIGAWGLITPGMCVPGGIIVVPTFRDTHLAEVLPLRTFPLAGPIATMIGLC